MSENRTIDWDKVPFETPEVKVEITFKRKLSDDEKVIVTNMTKDFLETLNRWLELWNE